MSIQQKALKLTLKRMDATWKQSDTKLTSVLKLELAICFPYSLWCRLTFKYRILVLSFAQSVFEKYNKWIYNRLCAGRMASPQSSCEDLWEELMFGLANTTVVSLAG